MRAQIGPQITRIALIMVVAMLMAGCLRCHRVTVSHWTCSPAGVCAPLPPITREVCR